MDEIQPVEVFRSMCLQKHIVNCVLNPEGTFTPARDDHVLDFLCSDDDAVEFFFSRYLDQPKNWLEQTKRMAYSALERNAMFEADLVLLSEYAQYIQNLVYYAGPAAVVKLLYQGFAWFRGLETQERIRITCSARSHANVMFCLFRNAASKQERPTKDVGFLLNKKPIRGNKH